MKGNSLPCVLPQAGGDNLGFEAMSRSNCSACSKHQAQTTSDPRPVAKSMNIWPTHAGFHDLWVPQRGMTNCDENGGRRSSSSFFYRAGA